MSYNVRLETFEGPFDLLFHLIEKAEVDIYNIPIAQIADQYIQYIHAMQKFDLEVTSEFLVMAATLIEIKSKMLLPRKIQEEQLAIAIEEIDPRQELITKLLEYKKYKTAAEELKKREDIFKKVFYKPQEQLDQYVRHDDTELFDLDLKLLTDAFHHLLTKKRSPVEVKDYVGEIQRDEVTIEYKIHQIRSYLNTHGRVHFERLFSNPSSKGEIVVTFLALLELIKQKFLIVQQNRTFDHIIVIKNVPINERGVV